MNCFYFTFYFILDLLYFCTITDFDSHYHHYYIIIVIITAPLIIFISVVIIIITSSFLMILTLIILFLFHSILYICINQIFLNFKYMKWPNIDKS